MNKDELIERYNTVKYILDISYKQLERYDGKTNQLLSLIGIDFTVLGIFTTFLFTNIGSISQMVRIAFLILVPIDMILMIISLYVVKQTLSPHLKPINKQPKVKNGLIFFKDIDEAFSKEDYVDIMLGNKEMTQSTRYQSDDPDVFYKCLIEDCSYDIYEQAEILRVKSSYIKRSYRLVFCATVLTFLTVSLLSILSFLNL